jgi:chemotaxis response regulator CheB
MNKKESADQALKHIKNCTNLMHLPVLIVSSIKERQKCALTVGSDGSVAKLNIDFFTSKIHQDIN